MNSTYVVPNTYLFMIWRCNTGRRCIHELMAMTMAAIWTMLMNIGFVRSWLSYLKRRCAGKGPASRLMTMAAICTMMMNICLMRSWLSYLNRRSAWKELCSAGSVLLCQEQHSSNFRHNYTILAETQRPKEFHWLIMLATIVPSIFWDWSRWVNRLVPTHRLTREICASTSERFP